MSDFEFTENDLRDIERERDLPPEPDDEPDEPGDEQRLFDELHDVMHYAGRNFLHHQSTAAIEALMKWNEGNAWIQEVCEEELYFRA